MSNTSFTPKGGWYKGNMTVFVGKENKGKSLINPTASNHGHWKPEMFTVPCTKENETGCGVCATLEGK